MHNHTVAENGVSDMTQRQVLEHTKTQSITHSRRKTVYRIWPGDRFWNTQCTITQSQKKVMAISLMFNCAILPITTNFKLLDYLRPVPDKQVQNLWQKTLPNKQVQNSLQVSVLYCL